MSVEAMKQALEALDNAHADNWYDLNEGARTALIQAIEQAETDWEAVAADQAMTIAMMKQREWVGITDEEIDEMLDATIGFDSCFGPETAFARAIEAKLKEKNT